jgi:hypothetical protein
LEGVAGCCVALTGAGVLPRSRLPIKGDFQGSFGVACWEGVCGAPGVKVVGDPR